MENMNNEIIETTDVELIDVDTIDVDMDESCEGNDGAGKVVLGIGLGLLAVAGAVVVKNKDKIKAKLTERRIAKLEKQGYIVVSQEEVDAAEEEIVVEGEVIDADETEE